MLKKRRKNTFKALKNSIKDFFKHIYFTILLFILNTNVCFAGDNSDKILFFMIGLMFVSAVGVVAFIAFGNKKK